MMQLIEKVLHFMEIRDIDPFGQTYTPLLIRMHGGEDDLKMTLMLML